MSTDPENKKTPKCYAQVDTVFPMGKDGLRHTPDTCLACQDKTECLRAAMEKSSGLQVKEEKVDRAYAAGVISFLERWSQKKDLNRKIKRMKKDEG